MHQINTRNRSVGAGEADFLSPANANNTIQFIRSSKITAQAVSLALDSVARNVKAAHEVVTNSMAFRLRSYVSGAVQSIGTWYVKRNSLPPLSDKDRLGLAIARFREKFQDRYVKSDEYKNLREKDPVTFSAVLTILKGSMSGAVLMCSADIEDFKKSPTMAKAKAIIDKYIVDPKLEDDSEHKPYHLNLYESHYQKFLDNYESVKIALAYQSQDAQKKLAGLFDPLLGAYVDAERGIHASIKAEISHFFDSTNVGKASS